ncbi:hypothetical protein [Paraburkholderia terrae]|uniref:hypothetical protein n=1 Tax=Paraburkholderia terrae TaxID=311230 RepID=UPI00206BAD24|nr:hypothetical protein [Paraburkholderia terrae]BDC37913.1 hypothetical protein PTKU15_12100 [Paraburkholderia terrae]
MTITTNTPNGTGNVNSAVDRIANLLTDDLTIDNTPKASKKQHREVEPHTEQPETDSTEHEEETEHSDEPESEHESADSDGQSEEGNEDDESNSPDEHDHDSVSDDTTFSIRDGDKDVTVTLAELKKGYARQSDYTRKMQALAEDRKALGGESAQSRQEREQYRNGLAQVQNLMKQLAPQEPTAEQWAALQAHDPLQWVQQREQWREYKEQLNAVAREHEALTQRQQAEYQQGLKALMASESEKLQAAFPEWKDKAKATAGRQAIFDYATALGYSPQEIETTTDHRIFVLAHKAMLYDKMVSKGKPQPTQSAAKTKVVRPGTAATAPNSKRSAVSDARKQFRSSGKVADAAALLEKLL